MKERENERERARNFPRTVSLVNSSTLGECISKRIVGNEVRRHSTNIMEKREAHEGPFNRDRSRATLPRISNAIVAMVDKRFFLFSFLKIL